MDCRHVCHIFPSAPRHSPCDLGVQRGLIQWFLSLHSPSYPAILSAKKASGLELEQPVRTEDDVIPVGLPRQDLKVKEPELEVETNPHLSSVPIAAGATPISGGPAMPTPLSPSINQTLRISGQSHSGNLEPLPEGLSVTILKSRLDGKKKIKGALLTPKEMESLTDGWRPYRSLGVYYMWSVKEAKINTRVQ